MKKKSTLKSTCCKADIKAASSPDFIGDKPSEGCTNYCVCSKCGKPCNIMTNERKIWIRNPKTQILGDKRRKIKDKIIHKEIKDY